MWPRRARRGSYQVSSAVHAKGRLVPLAGARRFGHRAERTNPVRVARTALALVVGGLSVILAIAAVAAFAAAIQSLKSFTDPAFIVSALVLSSLAWALWRLAKVLFGCRSSTAELSLIDRMSGTEFEDWLVQRFRQEGFDVEHVGKGGADLGGDILLTGDGVRIIVQAKRSRSPVGLNAVREAHSARDHYGAYRAWVITNQSFTRPARTLATSTGVELYDRAALKAWLEGSWPFDIERMYGARWGR